MRLGWLTETSTTTWQRERSRKMGFTLRCCGSCSVALHRTTLTCHCGTMPTNFAGHCFRVPWITRVSGIFLLLFRGRAVGEEESPNRVRLRYADELASEFDVAGRLVAAPDPPSLADRVEVESPALQKLFLKLQPRSVGGGKVEYDLSPDVFDEMKAIHRNLLNHLWQLDPDWDCGGYTLRQFREVWLALVTFSAAHQGACLRSGAEGVGLASVVSIKKKDRWEKSIVRWSNVSRPAVSAVLTDLTFTQELHASGRKQPDIPPLQSGLCHAGCTSSIAGCSA